MSSTTGSGLHRIMLMANAPWCKTGYGVQTASLAPRLRALGHELAVYAFYGLQGGMLTWEGIPVYPMGLDMWGADILPAHMKNFKADMLVTLMDVWVTDWFGRKGRAGDFQWYPWLPIDQEPAPAVVVERLEGCAMALPYARFGERMLHEAGVENTWYIPHGYEGRVFKPGDKGEARRRLGLPADAFIIGSVAANKGTPSRKCLPEQLMAFERFHRKHPNSLFYLHTLAMPGHDGIDVAAVCERLGIREAVRWTPPYSYIMGWPDERMAALYQAMDVLSATAMGEGFGIPILEAQACGTPVVTTAWSSMPELTWAGVCVSKGQEFWTPLGSWAFIPSVEGIVEGYEEVWEALDGGRGTKDEVRRGRLCEAAVEGARGYEWDRVVEDYWRPFLEAI